MFSIFTAGGIICFVFVFIFFWYILTNGFEYKFQGLSHFIPTALLSFFITGMISFCAYVVGEAEYPRSADEIIDRQPIESYDSDINQFNVLVVDDQIIFKMNGVETFIDKSKVEFVLEGKRGYFQTIEYVNGDEIFFKHHDIKIYKVYVPINTLIIETINPKKEK